MATLAPATNTNPILDAFTQYHDKVSALNIGAGRDMSPKGTPPPPSTAVGTIGRPSEGIGNLTAYVDPQNPGWHASEAASAIATATKAPIGSPDISVNSDKITGIVNNLRKDYGLTREQAIGAVGWMGYESGNMSVMQEYGHSGTNSGWGWAQWTGPRRTNFMEYAAANKLDPASDEANYGFLKHELDTGYNHVLPKLQKATTVEEANQVWGKYFEGMREGGPGVPAFKQHADRAALYDTLIPPDEQNQTQAQNFIDQKRTSNYINKDVDNLRQSREQWQSKQTPGRPSMNDLSNLGGEIQTRSFHDGSFNGKWGLFPQSDNVIAPEPLPAPGEW